jgi:hypothetical protein
MASIHRREPIDIASDTWRYIGGGDPSQGAGYEAAVGSYFVDNDNGGDLYEKTGAGDTDWTLRLDAGAAIALDEDTADALAGTSGTPSAANPFVTDADPRVAASDPENQLNIRQEGAVGDNSNNDTQEIADVIATGHEAIATTSNRYMNRSIFIPTGKQFIVTAADVNTGGIQLASLQDIYLFGHGYGAGKTAGGYVPSILKGRGVMRAILDLHGVAFSTFERFTIRGEESGGTSPTYGLLYHKEAVSDPLSPSTRNVFRDLLIQGDYLTAGMRLGSTSGNGLQADLATAFNCHVMGGGNNHATKWQQGFHFGEPTWANALNYSAFGCVSTNNGRGVVVERTNLLWLGGTIQGNDRDINITTGLQGHAWLGGFRSENSRKLVDQLGAAAVFQALLLDGITFQLNAAANDPVREVPTLIEHYTHASIRGLRAGTMKSFTGTVRSGATASTLPTAIGQLPTVNGGVEGWTVRITGPEGHAAFGQKRLVGANDADGATSLLAWKGSIDDWDVVPDDTCTYAYEPCSQIVARFGTVLETVGIANAPIKHALRFDAGYGPFILLNYTEIDQDTNPVGWGTGGPAVVASVPNARYVQPGVSFGISQQDVDVRVMRLRNGTMGTASAEMYQLDVKELESPECHAAQTSTFGSTEYTYRLVAKYPDPENIGQFIAAAPGPVATVSDGVAMLTPTNDIRIHPKVLSPSTTPDLPAATHYDILKGGTTEALAVNVPWYEMPYRDIGQPTTPYTVNTSTTMGGIKAKRFGLDTAPVGVQSITGSTDAEKVASLIAMAVAFGLATDDTT